MLLLGSCSGVAGPDAGVDGGFADAPVVIQAPSRVIDESRDLGLLLEVRVPPEMRFGDPVYPVLEVTARDADNGDVTWLDREPLPTDRIEELYFRPPDPTFGTFSVRMRTDGEYPVLEYDPRSESLIEPVGGGLTEVPLDFGTFLRRPLGRV
jgi:hypothetical protein